MFSPNLNNVLWYSLTNCIANIIFLSICIFLKVTFLISV